MSAITIIPSYPTREGGFQIRRTFPSQGLSMLDPFLLFDYFGPMEVAPGSKPGVSDHPHRGFQTVTYLIQGEVEHNDSRGNHGVIKPGGIQWMSAGRGIIHSEFPSSEMSEAGGVLQGMQLWVNLPSEDKMSEPAYYDHTSEELPVIEEKNYSLRIIGGTYEEKSSPVSTYSPLFIAHLSLEQGDFEWKIDPEFNSGFVVFDGQVDAQVGDDTKTVLESDLAIVKGNQKVIISSSKPTNVILISGKPLNEPVVRYGPFVMNTEGEIRQAMLDYQAGTLY